MTPATTPADVATLATRRFVRSHVPPPGEGGVSVLEVGCGNGALAAHLVADGYEVVALDSSDRAVRDARASGVDARVATWPSFAWPLTGDAPNDVPSFDAILFTRSLHHIRPLGAALDRAGDLLAPGGVILVEDFAFAEVDRVTAAWFFGILSILDAAGVLTHRPGELATRLLEGGGAFELWQADHDHEITPAAELREALDARFDIIAEAREPYLYRYACPLLTGDERGARVAARIYDRERAAGTDGLARLIGRRFVARHRHPE
jgi:SAM-dependent methyltransferase